MIDAFYVQLARDLARFDDDFGLFEELQRVCTDEHAALASDLSTLTPDELDVAADLRLRFVCNVAAWKALDLCCIERGVEYER